MNINCSIHTTKENYKKSLSSSSSSSSSSLSSYRLYAAFGIDHHTPSGSSLADSLSPCYDQQLPQIMCSHRSLVSFVSRVNSSCDVDERLRLKCLRL
ncbi:hypothetical protein HAX54_016606 [Datura stramonium]|uniref:Uncharacterized protein n=1 Tax=Datura stramonium TaxID=4076 RepID=A0ABS8UKD8_DATST|nr:hypothetical protein [Datura stramonium]